jgi:hypothetical protein
MRHAARRTPFFRLRIAAVLLREGEEQCSVRRRAANRFVQNTPAWVGHHLHCVLPLVQQPSHPSPKKFQKSEVLNRNLFDVPTPESRLPSRTDCFLLVPVSDRSRIHPCMQGFSVHCAAAKGVPPLPACHHLISPVTDGERGAP